MTGSLSSNVLLSQHDPGKSALRECILVCHSEGVMASLTVPLPPVPPAPLYRGATGTMLLSVAATVRDARPACTEPRAYVDFWFWRVRP